MIRAGAPISGLDWSGFAQLANWNQGHGGMLVPWTAIGQSISAATTYTFHFYITPKGACVERIWCINARAVIGGTFTVKVDGVAVDDDPTFRPDTTRDGRSQVFCMRESLSAKTSTAADLTVAIAVSTAAVTIESIACYEQTRGVLDEVTTDFGTDITTLRARQPIADLDYQQVAAVMDGYKNLDARRAGFLHWSADVGSELSITAGVGSPAALFALNPPVLGAIAGLSDTTATVTVAAFAKVDAGTGSIRFQSTQAAATATLQITATSYGSWVTDTLSVDAEDLTVVDGRRGSVWEDVGIDAWVTATDTLNIQAISIVRVTAPV